MKILILCTGNSCRSQIAHGYLQSMLPESEIYSSGIETHGVNPRAILIMQEDSIDISHHTSNHIDEYKDIQFDIALTVCDHASESCPIIQNATSIIHNDFPDPAKANGTAEEIMASFRSTRNLIYKFIKEKIEEGTFQ